MAKEEKTIMEDAEKRQKKLQRRKKLKYGTLATVVTAIVIAVVVLVNVVVSLLCDRYPATTFDLTTTNVYDISDETLDYIKNLDQDVDIAVSAEESNFNSDKYDKMISTAINKYAGYSDRITVTYFDTTKDPDILAKYQNLYSGDISSNQIIVASGERIKVYSMTDMFDIDEEAYQNYYYYGSGSMEDCITGFKGEQTLTTAIMNVTNSNPKAVALIDKTGGDYIFSATNANGYAMSALSSLLDDNGYDVTEVDMTQDELNAEDYDIAVLLAPSNDLTIDSIEKLENFLYNDGNLGKQLVYIADYTQADTPNLDGFLKEWNMYVDHSYVANEDSTTNQAASIVLGGGQAYSFPVASVASEDYTGNLANTSLPIVAPMARAIDVLSTNGNRTVETLLTTANTSYRYPLTLTDSSDEDEETLNAEAETEAETEEETTTTSFDTSSAERGENVVMAMCRDQQSTGSDFIESDVIVMGSMSMLDYYLVQDSSYNNAEYFIGLLNSVCGKEDSIVIASKDMGSTAITVSESQLTTMRVVVIFVIPCIVLAFGVVYLCWRKKRS